MPAALIQDVTLAARLCFGLADVRVHPLKGGRVNESFVLERGEERFVLQRLNDIYEGSPTLGLNWKAVCEALATRGNGELASAAPAIFPARDGQYVAAPIDGGHVWRLTAHINGRPGVPAAAPARRAARLLGRLHTLLNFPLPIELLPPPEAELTNQRLSRPEDFEALRQLYRRHPRLDDIASLIDQGAEAALFLPAFPAFLDVFNLREVVIHGDPKADNFIFAQGGQPLALVDWDDVRYGHVLIDIAEMLRSWGRPAEGGRGMNLEVMAAVLTGYAETGLPLSPQDVTLLPAVLRGVSLTLARRYLTDSLAEVFFKWDFGKYPSLHTQNKSRAAAMLDMAEYLLNNEMRLVEAFQQACAPLQ